MKKGQLPGSAGLFCEEMLIFESHKTKTDPPWN